MPYTNTLDYTRRLEALGFSHEQAHGRSELLEETARAAQPDLSAPACRSDLHALRLDVQAMETRILRELRSRMFRFFTMLAGLLGVSVAVIKLLP